MHTNKTGSRAIAALFFVSLLIGPIAAFAAGAQGSGSVLYVPLIGITSVPDPLVLPQAGGKVTYNYAVKNFLQEIALTDVHVVDDACGAVAFHDGDDNGDGRLEYGETWRYTCTTTLSATTQSTATVTGSANGVTATHKAYTTVVVGSANPAPLVSVINVTKVAYPLSLPAEGGPITFTYRVNNPGAVPLSNVTIVDDKCSAMSGKLGDTNGNSLLDTNEVWIYTCTANLKQTTTNTVHVTAFANGLRAVDDFALTVMVRSLVPGFSNQDVPKFPLTGLGAGSKIVLWGIMSLVLAILLLLLLLTRKRKTGKARKSFKRSLRVLSIIVLAAILGGGLYFFLSPRRNQIAEPQVSSDLAFGWKFPVAKFPITGSLSNQIAYSSIRDPGGIPQGLPVRLKIPTIGVDSAIEDALITPDGRMDVPAGSENVAWFALGPHPGQEGSAVIGGHFGINKGVPFVFYDLDKLKAGDIVYVVNDKGETLAFVVRTISLFDRNADATTVFTSNDGLAHLNLITCEGVWNQVNGTYPQRRVVFTDAVPENADILAPILYQSLKLGARGADVAALQTALERDGFLTMPLRVAKGYFGTLTRAALIRYQRDVGLPATGVFNLATKSKLMPESKLPSTGTDAVHPSTVSTSETTSADASKKTPFTQKVRLIILELFATPLDGLITALLLLAIIVVSGLILHRRIAKQ